MTNTLIITMKTKTHTSWTPADVENLRTVYPIMPAPELITTFGRSFSAIDKKARSMGLLRSGVHGRRWTESEDAFIKSSLGIKRASQIADHLGRSAASIYNRICKLGLTRDSGQGRGHAPLGTERMNRGKLMRKVAKTGIRRLDWRRVDVIEWEAENGPVPEGMMLLASNRPRDGSPLRLVTADDIPMLAALNRMPPDVRKLIDIKAKIGQALTRLEKLNPDQAMKPRQPKTVRNRKKPRKRLARKPWSDQADEYLRANYLHCTDMELAQALCRGVTGIKSRLSFLGITRYWSNFDEQRFSEMYAVTSAIDLSKIFGRSVKATYAKASKLGLRKKGSK